MKRTTLLLSIAVLSLLAASAPSRATANTIVSIGQFGPNSYVAGVVVAAAPGFFFNGDALGVHDLVADQLSPGKPWCGTGKRFTANRCPAFYATTHGLNDPDPAPRPINGLADLAPGTYAFHCSLHPTMTGSFQVLA